MRSALRAIAGLCKGAGFSWQVRGAARKMKECTDIIDAPVPFLFFGVEDHPDYHHPSDTFEHIPQAFFAKTASLIVDTATVLDQHLDEVKAKR